MPQVRLYFFRTRSRPLGHQLRVSCLSFVWADRLIKEYKASAANSIRIFRKGFQFRYLSFCVGQLRFQSLACEISSSTRLSAGDARDRSRLLSFPSKIFASVSISPYLAIFSPAQGPIRI